MIYDGDCNFCKFWIIRWQRATAGTVDYLASQAPRVAEQFPELPRERFEGSVQFIETDGRVYSGAEAVFRSLAGGALPDWPLWLYRHVPGFAGLTEAAYDLVARHREGFSSLTRVLWGRAGVLPEQGMVRWLFLRLLGLIYLSAFVSLGLQIGGLMGKDGILPVAQFLEAARAQLAQEHIGLARYHWLPTLCWFSAGDGFLHFLCAAGGFLSVLVVLDVAPAPCLFLLWLIYLSLTTVGREFLAFQWDSLLLETGWLAIFFAPLQLLPRGPTPPPSRVVLWLLRWLLFRLMFESGLVKLLSGDPSWRGLTALNFHYQTQPLPTWVGWYAQQLPAEFQKISVVILLVVELGVPFLIFAPRRLRFVGCALLVFLQALILITGNYCFFNWLTLALCLLLLDDAALTTLLPGKWLGWFLRRRAGVGNAGEALRGTNTEKECKFWDQISVPEQPMIPPPSGCRNWPASVITPLAVVILAVTLSQLPGRPGWVRSMITPLALLDEWAGPFRSANGYGLFAVMTTSRPEIIIEGSRDGRTWLPYEFKYKPGDLKRRPAFVAPHQPRLDWQMWFAALGTYRENPWLVHFCFRLLQGAPEVLALLAHNPFPDTPPRYIRARVYEYQFSNFKERRSQGVWWRREFKGEYLPPISTRGN